MEFSHTLPHLETHIPCALQQHPHYGQALKAIGAHVHGISAIDGGRPIARMQVVERKIGPLRLRWLPRGPIWLEQACQNLKPRVLASLPEQFGTSACWITTPDTNEDIQDFSAWRTVSLLTAQSVCEIDLTQPPETRLAAQHGKWRNRLRHAQKTGLRVSHRPLDAIRDAHLLALELKQRQARRYSALPATFTQAWAQINPKATRLFMAREKQKIQTFILLLLHPPVATYHIGWSGPEGRRSSAHNLLIWEASNWLASQGYTRFDLGNIDTQYAPGLARFKIGSGATPRPLGPTFLRIPKPRPRWLTRHAAA